MKRVAGFCMLALGVASCGDGTPFGASTTTTTTGTNNNAATSIPEDISSDMSGFTFDPVNQTLTVQGVFLDADGGESVYRRRAGLDVPGYIAFTAQDDPLDQHATAYVAALGDVQAAVAVTGGQFQTFNGGATYGSTTTDFDRAAVAEDTGLVTYAGSYVGVTDIRGDGTDLATVGGTVDPALLPNQAAPVTGNIFINVDFADATLEGIITDRVLDPDDALLAPGQTTLDVPDIVLLPTGISGDGSFAGDVAVGGGTSLDDTGDYGGIFGGDEGQAVAGGIYIIDHLVSTTATEEEFGIFVLGRCGTALQTSSICSLVGN
ncbi:MAG: thymidylate synthase [Pseudomonadota bacterium]